MTIFLSIFYVLFCYIETAICSAEAQPKPRDGRPNIVIILTDDQDRRLGSLDYQNAVQERLIAKGVDFSNHFVTTALCCPSRVSLFRGQMAHNTNVTSVHAPGGNFAKFMEGRENESYLPLWLKSAGYHTEYIGKFLNGVNVLNYDQVPGGWDHITWNTEPYTTVPNTPVMSTNGETPINYHGFHQTDVIRAMALERLEGLVKKEQPWFLMLAPTAPHVDDSSVIVVPQARHEHLFQTLKAPRTPNFNPSDEFQRQKGSYLKDLPLMTSLNISWADEMYRRRLQSIQGLDEMVDDVIDFLEEHEIMDNTHFIYTSDNGYHVGNHRRTMGKRDCYIEDTNVPFVVRGPGVPAGIKSNLPSLQIDIAPTVLDIAGVDKAEWPEFFDGRSLLDQWREPNKVMPSQGGGISQEIMNVENWGDGRIEIPDGPPNTNMSYKSLRLVGGENSWLYIQWCGTNELELYNTLDDPYELRNLAIDPDDHTKRLLDRLNGLLLISKSCAQGSCRDVWSALNAEEGLVIESLDQAMDPEHDKVFANLPRVHMQECLQYQEAANEVPFYPELSMSLGSEYRRTGFVLADSPDESYRPVAANEKPAGTADQRRITFEEIQKTAVQLTPDQLCMGDEAGEELICWGDVPI